MPLGFSTLPQTPGGMQRLPGSRAGGPGGGGEPDGPNNNSGAQVSSGGGPRARPAKTRLLTSKSPPRGTRPPGSSRQGPGTRRHAAQGGSTLLVSASQLARTRAPIGPSPHEVGRDAISPLLVPLAAARRCLRKKAPFPALPGYKYLPSPPNLALFFFPLSILISIFSIFTICSIRPSSTWSFAHQAKLLPFPYLFSASSFTFTFTSFLPTSHTQFTFVAAG